MELFTLIAEPDENNEINYSLKFSPETEKQFKNDDYKEYLKSEVISAFIDTMHYNSQNYDIKDNINPLFKIEVGKYSEKDDLLPITLKEGPIVVGMKEDISQIREEILIEEFISALSDVIFGYIGNVQHEAHISKKEQLPTAYDPSSER